MLFFTSGWSGHGPLQERMRNMYVWEKKATNRAGKVLFFYGKVKQEDISRKHLKYGLPYFVEKVTDSSRVIYKIEKDHLIFVICFQNHKDYEKWYRNLK